MPTVRDTEIQDKITNPIIVDRQHDFTNRLPSDHDLVAAALEDHAAFREQSRRCRRVKKISTHPAIVCADQLRQLSGKQSASAVRKWASAQGIRVAEGKDGPWTTVHALNFALGAVTVTQQSYRPEDIL